MLCSFEPKAVFILRTMPAWTPAFPGRRSSTKNYAALGVSPATFLGLTWLLCKNYMVLTFSAAMPLSLPARRRRSQGIFSATVA